MSNVIPVEYDIHEGKQRDRDIFDMFRHLNQICREFKVNKIEVNLHYSGTYSEDNAYKTRTYHHIPVPPTLGEKQGVALEEMFKQWLRQCLYDMDFEYNHREIGIEAIEEFSQAFKQFHNSIFTQQCECTDTKHIMSFVNGYMINHGIPFSFDIVDPEAPAARYLIIPTSFNTKER